MTTPTSPAHGGGTNDSLAEPVGGNALNADGHATENPEKFGAGTPEGDPESNTNEETEADADTLAGEPDE
jgi:hypothetical protein